jgi:hypothetical protein
MARQFLNSLNHGHVAEFNEFAGFTGPPSFASGIADMEGLCVSLVGQYFRCGYSFGSKKTDLYVRWLVKGNGSMGGGVTQLRLDEDSTERVSVRWAAAPNGEFYVRANNVDKYGTNSVHGPISDGDPVWLELYFKAGTTTGQAKLWVNGELIVDFTGNVGTANGINRIRWGADNGYPNSYVDHLVVDDANPIGFSKVVSIFPSGTGSAAQFTPSTAPNWGCVDEAATEPVWAPNLEGDYNSVNTADQKDLFAAQDLPAEATGVKCVALRTRAFKNGAPTPTNITPLVKTGGTEYSGTNVLAEAMPVHGVKIWETNPNTTNPWTPTEVNNLEFGYKSAA